MGSLYIEPVWLSRPLRGMKIEFAFFLPNEKSAPAFLQKPILVEVMQDDVNPGIS